MPSKDEGVLGMASQPGKVGQINYTLEDSVVKVVVSDKVKQAKADTIRAHKRDILGVKGAQWSQTVQLPPSKYTQDWSDARLTNTLSAEHIATHDLRHTAKTTHVKADHTAHVMHERKALAGSGWEQSVATDCPLARQRQLQADTLASLAKTRRQADELAATGRYMDPVARQTALTESLRAAKAARVEEDARFEQQWGPEGAAAMRAIRGMHVPQRKPRGKATAEDVRAVRALDDFLPEADDGATTAMLSKQISALRASE